jgi:cathepsin L
MLLAFALSIVKSQEFTLNETFVVPEALDWRQKSAVNEVQDQSKEKDCGSCYAYAAIAVLESQYFVKTGKLLKLSEQEIVDCAAFGCNGGSIGLVYDYILKNGIATIEDYPYTPDKGKCRRDEVARSAVKIYGFAELPSDGSVKETVALFGPVVAGIYASPKHFEFYQKGIHNNREVITSDRNHAVVIVGYDTDEKTGLDYWVVRNSWSKDWGEDGYFRIMRINSTFGTIGSIHFPLLDEATKKSTTRFIQH